MAPEDYESLYRRSIIDRLDRLDGKLDAAINRFDEHNSDLAKEINELRVQLGVVRTTLQLKAGVWGAMAGLATGIGLVIILIMSRILH